MAKIDLPYVQLYTSCGRQYAYYRRGGMRERIPAEIGTPEFFTAYQELHTRAEVASTPAATSHRTAPGSLRALWLAYKQSAEWRALSPGTQYGYTKLIEPMLEKRGDFLISGLRASWIQRRMDEMTPSKANHFLAVMRLLLNWSIPRGWIKVNPTTGIRRVKHKAESHRVWTADEIKLMTSAEAGLAALPVTIALYTGQRLGDVLRLPWSAWDGKCLTVAAQGKTGARVVVPALPELRQALEAAEKKAVVICTRKDGHAWKVDHYKHFFSKTRASLGLPDDLHFHGLRHSAGKRLAEAGCTPQEIAAILGHKTLGMVTLYTAQAAQETLARAAITKLARHDSRAKRERK